MTSARLGFDGGPLADFVDGRGCRLSRLALHIVKGAVVSQSRVMPLERDAASALRIILGIMSDQLVMFGGEDTGWGRRSWNLDEIMSLEQRIDALWPDETWGMTEADPHSASDRNHPPKDFELHIEDAELILAGMAFTEMASAEFPWADMVRWTSDFISTEIRALWTDDEWRRRAAGQ